MGHFKFVLGTMYFLKTKKARFFLLANNILIWHSAREKLFSKLSSYLISKRKAYLKYH